MPTLHATRGCAQLSHNQAADLAPLTREERRRIALASLEIMKRRHLLKIVQIEQEKRVLLAQA
jgi:hypothetical protein